MSAEKRGLVRNVSAMVLVQVANYLMPMVSVPIIVRIIGPEKFGLINYAGAIVGYFVLLINYGFNLTATRKIAQNKSDQTFINRTFSQVLLAKFGLFILSLLIFVICFLLLPVFRTHATLFLSSFLICFAWVITPDWFYQGMQDLHRTAVFNLISKSLFTVLILLMIRKSDDYYWQPLAMSFAQIFVALISYRWAKKKYELSIDLSHWRSAFKLLWNERIIFFSSVVISLYTTTNTVILGTLSNAIEVGYYSAAQRFIIIAQSLISVPLSQTFFPYVGKAFGESEEAGIDKVRQIALPITVFVFLAGIVMFCIGPWFIQIFYGNSFNKSGGLFRLMAFLPFIICVSNLYGIQTMLNLQMDKLFFKITLTGAVISLLMNTVMVYFIGAWGAALTWIFTEVIITITMVVCLNQKGIKILSMEMFKPRMALKRIIPVYNVLKRRNH